MSNIIGGIFIAEAIIKIIVRGFCKGRGTYIRDPWNILDFIIVLFAIIGYILDSLNSINVGFLRAFRSLRALRPLRMVSKNEGSNLIYD
jgi:voltage-gated sodium channel type IX alpha